MRKLISVTAQSTVRICFHWRITETQMTEEEAILLIQKHERARQCRVKYQHMKSTRDSESKNLMLNKQDDQEISEIGRKAALKIQRVWRGFITRRKIKKQVLEEMLLIGNYRDKQKVIRYNLLKLSCWYMF